MNFLTISVALARHPDPLSARPPRLLAYAFLNAERRDETWRFRIRADAALTASGYPALLTSLADTLPHPQVLVARRPHIDVYDPLVEIAAAVPDAALRHHLAMRVARAFTSSVVDLDDLAALKRRRTGSRDPLTLLDALKSEVVDDWLHFLKRANGGDATGAIAATEAWLRARGGR